LVSEPDGLAERVEAMHKAVRLYGPKSPLVCEHCKDDDGNQRLYPCPTIALLPAPVDAEVDR
ncbi:hypothetical protein EFK50_21275, partial [Nocardioides marmoriginsengisoli]